MIASTGIRRISLLATVVAGLLALAPPTRGQVDSRPQSHEQALAMMLDQDPLKRRKGLHGLLRFPGPDATSVAVAMLADPHPHVRGSALHVLKRLGARSAVPDIVRVLQGDLDAAVRDDAVEALQALGAVEATPALIEALRHDTDRVRVRAAEALGVLRVEAAVPALHDMLTANDPTLRRVAVTALGWIDSPGSRAALERAAHDVDPYVRATVDGIRQLEAMRSRARQHVSACSRKDADALELLYPGLAEFFAVVSAPLPKDVPPADVAIVLEADSTLKRRARRWLADGLVKAVLYVQALEWADRFAPRRSEAGTRDGVTYGYWSADIEAFMRRKDSECRSVKHSAHEQAACRRDLSVRIASDWLRRGEHRAALLLFADQTSRAEYEWLFARMIPAVRVKVGPGSYRREIPPRATLVEAACGKSGSSSIWISPGEFLADLERFTAHGARSGSR